MQPYIGITGFMSNHEVETVLGNTEKIPEKLLTCAAAHRLIMIGVLASFKTLNGLPNKWPNRYPLVANIADIFSNHRLALNLIHYHTTSSDTLLDELKLLTELGGPNLHGFQLNIVWPDPQVLRFYKNKHSDKKIVLQISDKTLAAIDNLSCDLVTKIFSQYAECIDYILLDASGGHGRLFDFVSIYPLLKLLEGRAKYNNIGLGVAGGLYADTIHHLRELSQRFPNISWDAEGCLRNASDQLDLIKAENYLDKSLALFSSLR